MNLRSGVVWCVAYILGLLLTGLPWGWTIGPVLAIGAAIGLPRKWSPLTRRQWLIAGGLSLLASVWYQVRQPQPGVQDISRFVPALTQETITVQGTLQDFPHQARSGKQQLWLNVTGLDAGKIKLSEDPKTARGKLYVTLPQVPSDLYPGQAIALRGQLYQPSGATNPGAFDFRRYLAEEGCFTGLWGKDLQVLPDQKPSGGLWQIRDRIVRSQAAWLKPPEGALISAMVLGGKAVDLPAEIKDRFKQIGLSHALAASGFQTSLILGVVLALTRRLSPRIQVLAGGGSLLLFLGLAGAQPAVLRAVVMGGAVLAGIGLERRVKPLGSLLLAATLLLLWNPLWIWNLGFQLSVLATLGLLVTVPPLSRWLDWLPPIVTPAIAVPIAAYLWTIPLQLYQFGVVSPYSIPANILMTVLITVLSLGGMGSALLALIHPIAGSASAWLLHYPTVALLAIVEGFCRLPGNAIAIGSIPLGILLILYGLLTLQAFRPNLKRYGGAFLLAGLTIVFVPAGYAQANLTQVTALATSPQPVLVVQDRGKVLLVNAGDAKTTEMTLVPFLQQQGINHIDWAIALNTPNPEAWNHLSQQIRIKARFSAGPMTETIAKTTPKPQDKLAWIPLSPGYLYRWGALSLKPVSLDAQSQLLQLQIRDQAWLLSARSKIDASTWQGTSGDRPILWWTGSELPESWLQILNPQAAIAHGKRLHPQSDYLLKVRKTPLHWLARDGAVQWRPQTGVITTFSVEAADLARL